MKWFRRLLLILVIVLAAIQFVRPALTNPPVDPQKTIGASLRIPPHVEMTLNRSCRDCHSNETVWPWYSKVAPVSWLLARDTREARDEFSMSEWGTYPPKKAAHKLEEICEMVEKEEMPLWFYVPLHPDARLTPGDRQAICSWANGERARLLATLPPAEREAEEKR